MASERLLGLVDASVFALLAYLFNGEQLPTFGILTEWSVASVFAFCFPELIGAISNILLWSQPPSRSANKTLRILLMIGIRVRNVRLWCDSRQLLGPGQMLVWAHGRERGESPSDREAARLSMPLGMGSWFVALAWKRIFLSLF